MAQIERSRFGHYVALAVIAVGGAGLSHPPIYWIVATSLKSPSDIIAQVPQFLFRVTFEHYQKLMPDEVPGLTYVFIAEALIGILACFLPVRNIGFTRRFAFLWNGLLILTCLYALTTTVNYNFLMLSIYTIVVFLLIAPPQINRSETGSPLPCWCQCISNRCICTLFAHGGSKYFHQLLNSIIIGFGKHPCSLLGLGHCLPMRSHASKVAGKEDLLFFILSNTDASSCRRCHPNLPDVQRTPDCVTPTSGSSCSTPPSISPLQFG